MTSVDEARGSIGGRGSCIAGCHQAGGCRLAGGLGVAVPPRKRVIAGNMWGFCAGACSPLSLPPIKKPIHLVLLAHLNLLHWSPMFRLLLAHLRVHQSSHVVSMWRLMLGGHMKTGWSRDCRASHIANTKHWSGSSWDWCIWYQRPSTNHTCCNGHVMSGQW